MHSVTIMVVGQCDNHGCGHSATIMVVGHSVATVMVKDIW